MTALSERRPVVALETAVTTHGLPREPVAMTPRILGEDSIAAKAARTRCFGSEDTPYTWTASNPVNVELARAMAATIRAGGGVPATTAVLDGVLRLGLEPHEIDRLATERVHKCSTRDLAFTMATGASGGTTVAGTLATIHSAQQVLKRDAVDGLCVMATGGIGGVHRCWTEHPDVSADLRAMAHTQAVVVCAGAKIILDIPATREALDTEMIPVLGWQTNRFPKFTVPGDPNEPPIERVDELGHIANTCAIHWGTLARREGLLLVNEIPDDFGLDAEQLETQIEAALALAQAEGIRGPEVTPHLLSTLAHSTSGGALDANITVLLSNTALATRLSHTIMSREGGTPSTG